ncbi:MAG: class I SAM-dependent methyltransferase [Candidatus Limnocylindria bacterium]
MHQSVADEVAVAGGTVLDVGTGPGALAVEIAPLCPDCQVIGVDLAPEMLRVAPEGRPGGRRRSR